MAENSSGEVRKLYDSIHRRIEAVNKAGVGPILRILNILS